MVLIKILKGWEIPENQVTSEDLFLNRRGFMKSLIGAGLAATTLPLVGCEPKKEDNPIAGTVKLDVKTNPNFKEVERPITEEYFASRYNNFYEFGGTKNIWKNARALPTDSWKVEVAGLVKNPKTYDLDDLQKKFPIEERVYRFRCVEAWSMVVPWIGFAMKNLIADVEPTSKAKFVRFTSFYDEKITPGPVGFGNYPWPYHESLRLDEMANDLAFFATGIYGHSLPKQHGAPIRMVVPWKYGFKGAKSIVKIEFLDKQPPTFWNTLVASEYDFEANVNPNKPHPRWSQAEERIVGKGPAIAWEKRPTLLYNGYEDYVGKLYV